MDVSTGQLNSDSEPDGVCVHVSLCVCLSDRLEKEREILEERAEKRVEILKNLVSRTVDLSAVSTDGSKVI